MNQDQAAAQRNEQELEVREAAARRAEQERAAAEKEKQAEEQAKSREEALQNCCRALAKAGFERRSMNFMASADACDAAVEKKRPLSDVAPEIRQALKEGEELPSACQP
jgi:hypothetical protein